MNTLRNAPYKMSIRQFFFLAICVGVVICSAAYTLVQTWKDFEHEKKSHTSYQLQISDLMSSSLREPIIQGSYVEINLRIQSFLKQPHVLCIAIKNLSIPIANCEPRMLKSNHVFETKNTLYYNTETSESLADINIYYDNSGLYNTWLKKLRDALIINLILALLVFSIILTATARLIRNDLQTILDECDPSSQSNRSSSQIRIKEFSQLFEELKKYISAAKFNAEAHAANDLANQVAHDIRSPLTALNLVVHSAKELPEEKRVIIRNAAQRINDIANNLLEKSRTQQREQKNTQDSQTQRENDQIISFNQKYGTYLLSSLIDTIVSEKRIQYREKINVNIEADLNQAYGLFAQINDQEFQRVLSNLINNSVEALHDNKGEVKISIRGYTNNILIVVLDDGKGIPKYILEKLGEVGLSHGKDGAESGNGLGVAHAKKTIESFDGKFEIKSRENEGTMINITLPREQTPNWFVEELQLNQNTQVISIDDDVSIHQVWNDRFKSLAISESVNHLSFTSTKSFINWFSTRAVDIKEKNSSILYLIDYEFLNETTTGLDLIEKFDIATQAILITSRYDDPQIRTRCEKLGIKLIPKSMAGHVPISQVAGTSRSTAP